MAKEKKFKVIGSETSQEEIKTMGEVIGAVMIHLRCVEENTAAISYQSFNKDNENRPYDLINLLGIGYAFFEEMFFKAQETPTYKEIIKKDKVFDCIPHLLRDFMINYILQEQKEREKEEN